MSTRRIRFAACRSRPRVGDRRRDRRRLRGIDARHRSPSARNRSSNESLTGKDIKADSLAGVDINAVVADPPAGASGGHGPAGTPGPDRLHRPRRTAARNASEWQDLARRVDGGRHQADRHELGSHTTRFRFRFRSRRSPPGPYAPWARFPTLRCPGFGWPTRCGAPATCACTSASRAQSVSFTSLCCSRLMVAVGPPLPIRTRGLASSSQSNAKRSGTSPRRAPVPSPRLRMRRGRTGSAGNRTSPPRTRACTSLSGSTRASGLARASFDIGRRRLRGVEAREEAPRRRAPGQEHSSSGKEIKDDTLSGMDIDESSLSLQCGPTGPQSVADPDSPLPATLPSGRPTSGRPGRLDQTQAGRRLSLRLLRRYRQSGHLSLQLCSPHTGAATPR